MNTSFFQNLLLPMGIKGLFWSILIFTVCFIGTHVAVLAKLGWDYKTEKEKPDAEKTKEEKNAPEKPAPQTAQEPVYYIVEKKTRRAKASYGEPKQIHFKGGQ